MAHKNVISQNGYVWFGKVGKPITEKYIPYVKDKIKNNEKVYVLFLKQNKNLLDVYKSEIIDITREDIRKTEEYNLIPEYYRDQPFSIGFWLKLQSFERLTTTFLNKVVVSSSKMKISNSLGSTAGSMYIEFLP